MPDLVAWVFRSPLRFAGVVAAVLGVLIVGSLLTGSGDGGQRGTGAPASAPTGTAVAGSLPDAAPFVAAAVRFTAAWAQLPAGTTAAQWRAGLQPLVTADLARGLALTDPAQLPGTQPAGTPTVAFLATSSALVRVPLGDGSAVLVTVVDTAGRRLVSDVQPDQGDTGLATGLETSPVPAGATP